MAQPMQHGRDRTHGPIHSAPRRVCGVNARRGDRPPILSYRHGTLRQRRVSMAQPKSCERDRSHGSVNSVARRFCGAKSSESTCEPTVLWTGVSMTRPMPCKRDRSHVAMNSAARLVCAAKTRARLASQVLLSLPTRVAIAAPCGVDASGHPTRPRHPHNRPTACVVPSLRQVPTGSRSGGAPDTPTSCDRVWHAAILPARPENPAQPTHSVRPGDTRRLQRQGLGTIEQHAHTHAAYVALSCLPYATLAAPHPPTHTLALRCSGQGIQRSRNHGGRTGGTAARDRAGQEHIRHQTLRSWEVARGCTPLSSRVSSTALGF